MEFHSDIVRRVFARFVEAKVVKKDWPLSKEVYQQLRKHFQSTNREGLPQETVDLLVGHLKAGDYPDVLKEPPQKTLYRGLKLKTREDLAELLGTETFEDKGSLDFPEGRVVSQAFGHGFEEEQDKRGRSTSWSASKKYTRDFSEDGKRGFGVTLLADPSDNPHRFLAGPGGLYDVGLSRWHLERESVGLEPIKIRRIEWKSLSSS